MDYMQEVTWLQKRFQEVPSDNPAEKRVKFQIIHQSLATQFPSTKFNSKVISDTVTSAFPESSRVSVGKSKTVHVVDIEVMMSEEQQPDDLEQCQVSSADSRT